MSPLDGSAGPAPHFSWRESCARPDDAKASEGLEYLRHHSELWPATVRVAEVVEAIRSLVGRAVRVTCGLRPGDSKQHGSGQAWDIQVDGLTPRQLLRVIRTAADQGALPHELRQVIAESMHGTAADLDLPMSRGSGRWVHVAVLGTPDERWSVPSGTPWALSWDPPDAARVYRSAT